MELNNLQIGANYVQQLMVKLIFDDYIENPQGEKCRICCKKDKDVTNPTIVLTNPVKQIAEIIEIYNKILDSDYITEEMLNDNNLIAEEIWKIMQ